MKKKIIFIVIIATLFCLSSSYKQKDKPLSRSTAIGGWSGTLRLSETYQGELGMSEKVVLVSFHDAIPTQSHEEDPGAVYADAMGNGSVTFHAESIIAGKKIGYTDGSGSGAAELHEVSIDFGDNSYYIHAVGPECNGTSVSLIDNSTTPYGPERTDIVVSHSLGTNPNQLSGTNTSTTETGTGPVTTTISWNLSRSTGGELIVTPDNYEDWLPEPGRDELTLGNSMKISLKLHGRGGGPPLLKARSFELKLSNTSKEPGITLNAPLSPIANLPDLRFLPQANATISQEFQFAKINPANGISAEILIGSFDGGGYTTLTVEAVLVDNSRVTGHLLISGGNTETPIPKRTANSNIGLKWLNANQNPGEMDDKETSPGNSNDGDGLTAYEEYRGVWSEGRFKRLDPNEKELGVWGKKEDLDLFSEGLNWFELASNMKIVKFSYNEIGQARNLNKNFKTSHNYNQYVLKLEKKHIRKNVLGRTEPGPGIPKTVARIKIDYDQIVSQFVEYQAAAIRASVNLPFTETDFVAKTVAHELGHGVAIMHHGEARILDTVFTIPPGRPIRVFGYYGRNEITDRPYTLKGTIGDIGNQESGDVFCVMNYQPCFNWSIKTYSASVDFYAVPLLGFNAKMCNSGKGTDFNELDANQNNNYFGNAFQGRGNCLKQINLK